MSDPRESWAHHTDSGPDHHVWPLDDAIEHVTEGSEDCPCGPATEPVERPDGSCGWLVTHHSLDGREHQKTEHCKIPDCMQPLASTLTRMTTAEDTYGGHHDYSRGNGVGRLTLSKNSPMSDLGDYVLEHHDGLEAVGIMRDLTRVANEFLHYAVKQARDEGATWASIGEELEITRQAAQERFGR